MAETTATIPMSEYNDLLRARIKLQETGLPKEGRELLLSRLKKAQESDDNEVAHADADQVLCDALASLGYTDLVEEWKKVEKWYA